MSITNRKRGNGDQEHLFTPVLLKKTQKHPL